MRLPKAQTKLKEWKKEMEGNILIKFQDTEILKKILKTSKEIITFIFKGRNTVNWFQTFHK
jgi:hypothetical protein